MQNKITKFIVSLGFAILAATPFFVYAQNTPTTNSNFKTTSVVVQEPATDSTEGLPVYNGGVDKSIQDYLCTPSEPADGKDLERCVGRLYRFGISAGAIVVVFLFVYAGYTYITGGESGKTSAKKYIQNSLIGMAVLLGSYVLLNFVNPSLLKIKPIQPPIFTASDLPSCGEVGFGEKCLDTAGQESTGGAPDQQGGGGGGGTILGGANLLLGDSLMVGVKSHLAALLGSDKVVGGKTAVGGSGIQNWISGGACGGCVPAGTSLTKAKDLVSNANPKPEVAFVILGTNNIVSNSNVGTWTKNLISDLKTAGIKQVVWVGTPHFTKSTKEGGSRDKYSNIVESNTKATNAALKSSVGGCFFDTYSQLGNKVWVGNDSYNEIHPPTAGYKAWAQAIYDWYKAGNCK